MAAWHLGRARRCPPRGLLHHSDRGAQYTSTAYHALLEDAGVRRSMSRPRNCWDNAPVESFFRTLKSELMADRGWPTRDAASRALASYLDFYNTRRLHSSLNYQSPAAFEAAFAATV